MGRTRTLTTASLIAVLLAGLPAAQGKIPPKPPTGPPRNHPVVKEKLKELDPKPPRPPVPEFPLGPAGQPAPVPAPWKPSRALAGVERELWREGLAIFSRTWTQGDGATGGGAVSCMTCHRAPVIGGAGNSVLDVFGEDYDPRLGHPKRRARDRGKALRVRLQTPSLLGLGKLESIPDAAILANEDPDDLDGDGVRGVASRVRVGDATEIGRFGWRAQAPTLSDFACGELSDRLGLTVAELGRDFGTTDDADGVKEPEVANGELAKLVYFLRMLAPPDPRVRPDENQGGRELFGEIGCATCHVPELQGVGGPVPLYSDLLLHAVVKPLPEAGGGEPRVFRTPPLWGVVSTAPYLHDGRAATLEDAILAHDGEAERARKRYELLDANQRLQLQAFLRGI